MLKVLFRPLRPNAQAIDISARKEPRMVPYQQLIDNCCYRKILPRENTCPTNLENSMCKIATYTPVFGLFANFGHLFADERKC